MTKDDVPFLSREKEVAFNLIYLIQKLIRGKYLYEYIQMRHPNNNGNNKMMILIE